MKRYLVCLIGFTALLSPGLAVPAHAQSPPDTTAASILTRSPATLLRGGQVGELLSVYLPREDSEIQRFLDDAKGQQRSADKEVDEARRIATEADGRARIMKEEIETTKLRLQVAKKSKDDAARLPLEATLKKETREREYLEKLRDALRADADRLEAEREATEARVKALEKEHQVLDQYARMSVADPVPQTVAEYRSLLREMLNLQKQSADLSRQASEKRKQVAERRLKQLDALSKLSKPSK